MDELDKPDLNTSNLNEQVGIRSQEIAETPPPKGKLPTWTSKINKKVVIAATVVLLLGVIALTDAKYLLTGWFITGNAKVVVADSKTLQPISAAKVTIDGKQSITNQKGVASLSGVHVGSQKVVVTKTGYQTSTQSQTLGFGTSQLKPILLKGKGITVAFLVTDKISNEPLEGASITVYGNKALTNKKGEALLNVLPRGGVVAKGTVAKTDYDSASIDFQVAESSKPNKTSLIPSGKVFFVSNRSGKYDIYSSDLGGNQKVVLAATGKEDQRTQIIPSTDGKYVALISTREGLRDASGELITGLYIIDASTLALTKIDSAQNYNGVEWSGGSVIAVKQGQADSGYQSNALIYNVATKQSNTISGVSGYAVSDDRLYYSLANKDKPDFGLFSIKIDGSDRKKLTDGTYYSLIRTSQNTIVFNNSDDNTWKSINTDTKQIQSLPGAPSDTSDNIYILSPDRSKIAYSQLRDGNVKLFAKPVSQGAESLVSKSGNVVNYGWLSNNYLAYQAVDAEGSAIYVGAANGKGVVKISSAYVPSRSPYGIGR